MMVVVVFVVVVPTWLTRHSLAIVAPQMCLPK